MYRFCSPSDASVEPPTDTMSEQIPETRKGSWFGSISRKRKRKDVPQPTSETLATEEPPNVIPEVELAAPPQPASTTMNDDPQPESPPAEGDIPVEPPKQITLDNVPPPSWPSTSPPQTVPQNAQGVLPKPAHPVVHSPTISITSVDDLVPQPKSLPALSIPVPPQNPVPMSIGGIGDVTTTGATRPTPSRFTLRMPLLGRPKIPLDQAVAIAQVEDIRSPTIITPVSGDPDTPLSTTTSEEVQRPDIPAVPSNTSTW